MRVAGIKPGHRKNEMVQEIQWINFLARVLGLIVIGRAIGAVLTRLVN